MGLCLISRRRLAFIGQVAVLLGSISLALGGEVSAGTIREPLLFALPVKAERRPSTLKIVSVGDGATNREHKRVVTHCLAGFGRS